MATKKTLIFDEVKGRVRDTLKHGNISALEKLFRQLMSFSGTAHHNEMAPLAEKVLLRSQTLQMLAFKALLKRKRPS